MANEKKEWQPSNFMKFGLPAISIGIGVLAGVLLAKKIKQDKLAFGAIGFIIGGIVAFSIQYFDDKKNNSNTKAGDADFDKFKKNAPDIFADISPASLDRIKQNFLSLSVEDANRLNNIVSQPEKEWTVIEKNEFKALISLLKK